MTETNLRKICNLDDEEFAARREMLRKELLPLAQNREDLPDGLALYFDVTPKTRKDLQDFLSFERQCCPELDFSVQEDPAGLRLEIRGIDPKSDFFAGMGRRTEATLMPESTGWKRLLRSIGLGGSLALFVCCVLPLAIATFASASILGRLTSLDDPWVIGISGVLFALMVWVFEGRRARNRERTAKTIASAGECGC